MLIDTHCHINMIIKDAFDTPLHAQDYELAQEVITRSSQAGVDRIINIGTSLVESINCLELAKKFKEVYAAIAIHPNDLSDHWKQDIKELQKFLDRKKELKIKAIGECGLDYHYPDYVINRQKQGFKTQIELALEYNLPLVIHTRSAGQDVLNILDLYKNNNLRGVIHCFSEDLNFAERALNLNFALGIGGAVTYPKNNSLREVVKAIGLDHILLETDAPFLPPQHMRGKTNYPEYIKPIAEYIADLLEISFEDVAKKTTSNAEKLFNI